MSNKKKIRIGIFDSGLGGVSVLKGLLYFPSHTELYYLSDEKFSPYGDLSPKLIEERGHLMVEKFLQVDVSLIVVACNTATAHFIDSLRKNYDMDFVGVEPYLNYINHTKDDGNFAVLITPATERSSRFLELKKRLDPESKIQVITMPKLASLIEKLNPWKMPGPCKSEVVKEIREELEPLKKYHFTHVILGCTHYPLITNLIESILSAHTIDPAQAVLRRVADKLAVEFYPNEQFSSFKMDDLESSGWKVKQLSDFHLLPR